jgi:tripartite ATP-independent transporter DctM subunit
VGKLFLAGVVPGCTMALMLFIPAYVISIKRSYPYIPFPGIGSYLRGFVKSFARGIFPLFTPIIILGSIMFGIATPTEAAVLAVLYSLALGFCYRSIRIKDIPNIFLEAAVDSAIVLFIVSAVSAFSWMLTSKEIPQTLTTFIFNAIGNPTLVVMAIIGLLVILGLFMNPTPGLLLCVPLLLPVAQKLGMNLVQFGVMIVLTLAVGLLTPPVGLVLYIVANIAKVEVGELIKELFPFIIALLIVVFLVAFVPNFTLVIPNFFYGK